MKKLVILPLCMLFLFACDPCKDRDEAILYYKDGNQMTYVVWKYCWDFEEGYVVDKWIKEVWFRDPPLFDEIVLTNGQVVSVHLAEKEILVKWNEAMKKRISIKELNGLRYINRKHPPCGGTW